MVNTPARALAIDAKFVNKDGGKFRAGAKKGEKPNFSARERAIILEAAEENIHIIKSKFSNNVTNKNKIQIWEDIAERVNAIGVCKRLVMQIKEKWQGMVINAKKEHNQIASDRKKTGCGRKPDYAKGETLKIINIFGEAPSFSGIPGEIESGKLVVDKFRLDMPYQD